MDGYTLPKELSDFLIKFHEAGKTMILGEKQYISLSSEVYECPPKCPVCKTPQKSIGCDQWDRACECHLKCDKCGQKEEYFGFDNPHPDYSSVLGVFCRQCGPFPSTKESVDRV